MPWRDWQFWIVSILALGGMWILLRPFIPRRRGTSQPPPSSCGNCASGSASARPRRVNITIEKRRL